MHLTDSSALSKPPSWDRYGVVQQCRAHYLQRLVVVAQEAGVLEPRALEQLQEGAGAFFEAMVSAARRSGFEQADGLTASRISLVDDNQLEQELRRDDIARRLYDRCAENLWRLHLRCVTLLNRPELVLKDNPMSPDGVSAGLAALCAALGLSQEKILDLLDRLEQQLALHMPVLYGELADLLAQAGVAAAVAQRSIVQAPSGPAGEPASGGEDPLAALKGALLQQTASPGPTGGGVVQLAPAGGGPVQVVDTELLERLLDRLKTLDAFTPTNPELIMHGAGSDGPGRPPAALNARNLGVAGPDGASIDALALIFEAIFAHPQLAEGARAAIVGLQIPVLKLALQDRSFFSERQHPARLTLDRMAVLATGLPPSAGFEHPVCQQLNQIAAGIRNAPRLGSETFTAALAGLDAAIAARGEAIEALAAAYQPLVARVEQEGQAASVARQFLASRLQAGLPQEFVEFLEHDWFAVLEAACRTGGVQGQAWQAASGLVDELLWSIAPKQTQEERQRLAALIPSILKRIPIALAAIGRRLDPGSPFLDACFALQTAAMRGRALPPAAPARPQGGLEEAIQAPVGRGALQHYDLEAGGRLLKVLRYPEPGNITVTPGRRGEWLEFQLPDAGAGLLCGRLSWDGPGGEVLLANPDWDFAVYLGPGVLDALLRVRQASRCNATSLFDEAAEQAARLMAAAS